MKNVQGFLGFFTFLVLINMGLTQLDRINRIFKEENFR